MRRLVLLAALLTPSVAAAHFHLDSPPVAYVQDTQGDPQKTGPCGGSTTATTMVTNLQPGSMLPLTITETIPHAGWYRVSIAQNEAALPAMPTLQSCGAATINQNPTMPLIADGVFEHTAAFTTAQTKQVQLPAGFECNDCVVQIVEVMTQSTAPACYYYHCARVNISASAPPMADAGVRNPGTGGDAGTTDPSSTTGGCNTSGHASPLLLLGLLLRRRRR